MNADVPAYSLWPLVVINAAVFIIFAFSFSRPRTGRDWRSFGAFSAFIVALFTEMYGFPLTIYLLSGCLGSAFPGISLLSHNTGHLWETLMGWQGDPHLNPLHLISYVVIFGGFSCWLLPGMCSTKRSGRIPLPRLAPIRTSVTRSMWALSSSCWGSYSSG